MNILTLENIEKNYSERKLFDKASFYLQEGEKVGIIGINGTGKSTLLRMMAGEEEPDDGRIVFANHVVVCMLPQQPVFAENMTVIQAALGMDTFPGRGLQPFGGDVTQSLPDMQKISVDTSHFSIEAQAKQMLAELGITDFDVAVHTLSGGLKKRVAIVRTLLSEADILLMDEPTNHLDSQTSQWLENYLKKYRGAVVLVTHDRYFLDSVVNRIVEIDKGQMYSYDANYAGFLELKAAREDMEDAGERKRQSILRVELEWVKRGARARTTKQKARLERYEELKSRRAPVRDGSVELSSISSRLGRTTVELHHVGKSYDRKLFSDFTYIFLKGDRIGFVGENGCGKTTMMKIIAGFISPDEGEVVVGQTVKIGYYSQEWENNPSAGIAYMDPQARVIDYIRDTAEYVRTKDGLVSASSMLDKFLFPPQEQYARIEKLSGGEKKRLNLLRVLMEAPNVLILDEPTNDLDIQTLTILEDYLDSFDGIVIVVSHDRYFLDRVTKRLFVFEPGGIRQFEGNYSDYALVREMERVVGELPGDAGKNGSGKAGSVGENINGTDKAAPVDVSGTDYRAQERARQGRAHSVKVKFTYKEQQDWETIEDQIAALEGKIESLEGQIAANAKDFVKLNELMSEKEQTEGALEERMERWMYLQEKYEEIMASKE
ncbi:MAG: ABC-F family ATP-binding cassette domain-containing protein [Lachnospiraceae bacterium]|nr:ABC-F family ATP-binding cassette domain-containing protein [bacterium]MDY5518492.1 ABC-F family ATP-binding cassette domain-containing protein [Lachnospiraceae bacterium]